MKRKIIKIDEDLCNGCGNCISGCSEGALQMVDGKAKLMKEDFCDGFGDCIGTCPTGALTIEERETVAFSEEAVKEHLLGTQGIEAVWRMEEAQKKHEAKAEKPMFPMGCPGSQMREMKKDSRVQPSSTASGNFQAIPSELQQWPVQIHLVSPQAPYFNNKELVVMSTCGPLALADVHWRFLRGRSVVVGCPKLDDTSNYAAKLGAILQQNYIPKVIVPRMEVPCCGGLTMLVKQAISISGKDDIILEETIIAVNGEIRSSNIVN